VISSNYLLFLPLFVVAYLRLQSTTQRLVLLTLAGLLTLFFSGVADFLIILALLVVTWFGTELLSVFYKDQRWPWGALIALEIAPLLFYKFIKVDFWGLVSPGLLEAAGVVSWLPPLGLSVLTFQAVSFTVDRFKGELKEPSKLSFLVYMTFFPHLIAGPILKASEFIAQLITPRQVELNDIREGLWRILIGLVKKLVLSDVIARTCTDSVFVDSGSFSSWEIAIALFAYTLQIYLDFSGYTDVVIGSARMMGLKLPENFDKPYHARSISDYWRRWHMSLSAWVNLYVYRPLGGSRVTTWKIYRNVMISILLLAVWHGLSFNFLLYGLIHGSAVCFNRWIRIQSNWKNWVENNPRLSASLCWLMTILFVVVARILFRTPNLEEASIFVMNFFESELSGLPRFSIYFWLSFVLGIFAYALPRHYLLKVKHQFVIAHPLLQGGLFAFVLMCAGYLSGGQVLNFIYRNF
jgi:D-alanyl-lipoteichoic acid acyltransferase DltB (MBOAT superfamily)